MSIVDRVLYDKDIREPLFFFLEETYGKVMILEEKRIGSARADVVMITPTDMPPNFVIRGTTKWWIPYDIRSEGAFP